jgi:hypothetical protein
MYELGPRVGRLVDASELKHVIRLPKPLFKPLAKPPLKLLSMSCLKLSLLYAFLLRCDEREGVREREREIEREEREIDR